MYSVKLIHVNNEWSEVPFPFKTEDDAWAFITQVMSMPAHPKMMWVERSDDPGDAVGNGDSSSKP